MHQLVSGGRRDASVLHCFYELAGFEGSLLSAKAAQLYPYARLPGLRQLGSFMLFLSDMFEKHTCAGFAACVLREIWMCRLHLLLLAYIIAVCQ